MSTDAVRAVLQRSPSTGAGRLVLVLLAHASQDRGNYPHAAIGYRALAKQARLSLRRVKAIITELLDKGQLFLVQKGGGEECNTYEIPVLKADTGGVSYTSPLLREEPKEQTTRADLTVQRTSLPIGGSGSIIPFPVKYGRKGSKSEGIGGK